MGSCRGPRQGGCADVWVSGGRYAQPDRYVTCPQIATTGEARPSGCARLQWWPTTPSMRSLRAVSSAKPGAALTCPNATSRAKRRCPTARWRGSSRGGRRPPADGGRAARGGRLPPGTPARARRGEGADPPELDRAGRRYPAHLDVRPVDAFGYVVGRLASPEHPGAPGLVPRASTQPGQHVRPGPVAPGRAPPELVTLPV